MTTPPTFPSFADYFRALHGHDPFPWQDRLAAEVLGTGWPAAIALPTAAGKTATLDIATWALAHEAYTATVRRMPRRMILVVDRRLVVDDAFARAARIARAIGESTSGPLAIVKAALGRLGGEIPLHATVLRGAIHRDERWARTPLQPTLVVSTVDQVGSRLLFRGYGLSSSASPIHAGLLANDTLLILDEAHLSQPFEQNLEWIAHHRRQGEAPLELPFAFVRMTATPPRQGALFTADDADRQHPVLGRRLAAAKPAQLVEPVEAKKLAREFADRAAAQAKPGRTIAVVVNRVATAREVIRHLADNRKLSADLLLLTGRARPIQRDRELDQWRHRLASGRDRSQHATAPPLIVVATQCIEAGADVDFDHLLTECAPLDALRQRFGRLDRLGELPPPDPGTHRAAILIDKAALREGAHDPVYGPALAATWRWLERTAKGGVIDMGIAALALPPDDVMSTLLAPQADAPLLQRVYCDLLAQTSPEPEPSPDPSAFLHGINRGDPEVQIVWRADLGPDTTQWADIVALCPPVAGEALPLRLSAARRWLAGGDLALPDADLEGIAPPPPEKPRSAPKAVAAPTSEEEDADEAEDADDTTPEETPSPANGSIRPALRWRGIENSDIARDPAQIRPGDTLVVPCSYGGCDRWGWAPESEAPVDDLADVARESAGRARVWRLVPELVPPDDPQHALLAPLVQLTEPPEEGLLPFVREVMAAANHPLVPATRVQLHPAGRGVVLTEPNASHPTTFADDDAASSRAAAEARITLDEHQSAVGERARQYAEAAGLPPAIVATIAAAGHHHDHGKADPRFQALLRGGNRLAALREGTLLAKSGRTPNTPHAIAAAREAAAYPPGARHELLSTRLVAAALHALPPEVDPDLLLHLIASHHGRCRPFAPAVHDPAPLDITHTVAGAPVTASTATALERLDSGVARRYFRLTRRHGWWGLAYLESLLRLADHRVSEQAPQED
jgi:CRISPR-associated endonuclease/helicase Cas3